MHLSAAQPHTISLHYACLYACVLTPPLPPVLGFRFGLINSSSVPGPSFHECLCDLLSSCRHDLARTGDWWWRMRMGGGGEGRQTGRQTGLPGPPACSQHGSCCPHKQTYKPAHLTCCCSPPPPRCLPLSLCPCLCHRLQCPLAAVHSAANRAPVGATPYQAGQAAGGTALAVQPCGGQGGAGAVAQDCVQHRAGVCICRCVGEL